MATISAEQLFTPRANEEEETKVKTQAKPAVIPAEQVFVPRKSADKRYIVYLHMADEDQNSLCVKIDKRASRAQIIEDIIRKIMDYYEDITEEVDITGEVMFNFLSNSDIFCLNDNSESFAKTDVLAFLLSFRDIKLADELANQTYTEYMHLVVEYAENVYGEEDDYDANECRDVLQEEK